MVQLVRLEGCDDNIVAFAQHLVEKEWLPGITLADYLSNGMYNELTRSVHMTYRSVFRSFYMPSAEDREDLHGRKFRPVKSWDELLVIVEMDGRVYYWPPLDVNPSSVSARAFKNGKVRVDPGRPWDVDPFTADEGHLGRFFVKVG